MSINKIGPKELQEAINAVDKYGSIANAAKELGMPRKTLSGRYNKALDQGYSPGNPVLSVDEQITIDSRLKRLSQEKRDLARRYKDLLSKLEEKEGQLLMYEQFESACKEMSVDSIKVSKKHKKDSEATPILCYSDLHYEETVDPLTINNLNSYNTSIAKKRSDKFFENSIKLIEMCKSKSNIRSIVLWLGGDLINGYIHEEFLETNSMSPPDACLEVFSLLVAGIDFLLEHSGAEEIIVVTNVGNHSRTTQKQMVATNVQNNYEWLIYNFLAKYYEKNDHIKFKLTRGYFNLLDIYGYTIRFHHGENVRYAGGVGGLTIPLNKAIKMWDEAQKADLDILGHWHQRTSLKQAVVNGSIIGYNAYAMKIKAQFEKPQQSFLLMHPRWGRTVEAPIWLE